MHFKGVAHEYMQPLAQEVVAVLCLVVATRILVQTSTSIQATTSTKTATTTIIPSPWPTKLICFPRLRLCCTMHSFCLFAWACVNFTNASLHRIFKTTNKKTALIGFEPFALAGMPTPFPFYSTFWPFGTSWQSLLVWVHPSWYCPRLFSFI